MARIRDNGMINIAAGIPEHQHAQLQALADDRGVRLAELIRDALSHYLEGMPRGGTFIGQDAGYRAGLARGNQATFEMLRRMIAQLPASVEEVDTWISELPPQGNPNI